MGALESFKIGFQDGYRHHKRKTNMGSIYLNAYKRGGEARDRNDNGGEDVGAVRPRKKVSA